MARIIGGSPLGELSGKMGGIVFSRNKAGAYIRQYVIPPDPNTLAQQNARASFGSAAASWHNLTNAQKMQWQSFALSGFSPFKPSVGVAYTGFNAYVSLLNTVQNANNKILDPVLAADFVFSSNGGAITPASSQSYQLGVQPPVSPNPDGRMFDGTGAAIVLGVNSVALNSTTMAITVSLSADYSTSDAPIGHQAGEDVFIGSEMVDGIGNPVGYTVYVSNAVQQAQDFINNPHLINAGYIAQAKDMAGLGLQGNVFTMVFKSKVLLTASYQALPAPGEIRRITLYQVSLDGRHKLIGARTCTVS